MLLRRERPGGAALRRRYEDRELAAIAQLDAYPSGGGALIARRLDLVVEIDHGPFLELEQAAVSKRRLIVRNRDGGNEIAVPDGMIHHWVGLAFIPGAHVDDVLAILEDYDHQSTYYAPDVVRSKIESRDGDHFRVLLRFRRHKVVTVVLDTVHDVRYFRDSPTLAHSRSSTVRISQVENPGKSEERLKPAGDDDGFLWRMDTWWRVVERDGGVYVQSEVVSLTRDIPMGLAWMVKPFVTSIPQESLAFTMEATRKAVEGEMRQGRK